MVEFDYGTRKKNKRIRLDTNLVKTFSCLMFLYMVLHVDVSKHFQHRMIFKRHMTKKHHFRTQGYMALVFHIQTNLTKQG